jgi:hypothetical protein
VRLDVVEVYARMDAGEFPFGWCDNHGLVPVNLNPAMGGFLAASCVQCAEAMPLDRVQFITEEAAGRMGWHFVEEDGPRQN